EGTFAVCTLESAPTSTASVKVPPTSTPKSIHPAYGSLSAPCPRRVRALRAPGAPARARRTPGRRQRATDACSQRRSGRPSGDQAGAGPAGIRPAQRRSGGGELAVLGFGEVLVGGAVAVAGQWHALTGGAFAGGCTALWPGAADGRVALLGVLGE